MLNDTINILSLESYRDQIETIDLVKENNQLVYEIKQKRRNIPCPTCGLNESNIHSYLIKKIVHSIHNQMTCNLLIKYHRYRCKHCKQVYSEPVMLAKRYETISQYTKLQILDDLRVPTNTFTVIGKKNHISTQTVINLFDQYVEPKRLKLTNVICMDEFYLGKRSKLKYACVLLDFELGDIIEVFDTRHKHKLIDQLLRIPINERVAVQYVIIDMWDSYRDVIHKCFRNAKIAVDSFHVIWHLNKAMNDIRIRVMNRYKKKASSLIHNDIYYYMLKKYYFFLLVDYDKLGNEYVVPKLKTRYTKDNLLHYLLSIDDDLKMAFELKETYRDFNKTANKDTTLEDLEEIIQRFKKSPLEEIRKVGKMLNNWKTEILNSFIKIDGKRLSNSKIENKNSQIKTIMKTANGYKGFYRLRNRILFSLNKNTPIKGK